MKGKTKNKMAQSDMRYVPLSPPSKSPTPGLRRSRRCRIPTLAHWDNERVVYELTETGDLKAVGFEKFCGEEKKGKGLSKKIKETRRHLTEEFSIPGTEGFVVKNVALTSVLSPEGNHEIHQEVIRLENTLQWMGPVHTPAQKTDPYVITKIVNSGDHTQGFLKIRAKEIKPLQRNVSHKMIFTILKGNLKVQVHETSWLLTRWDSFIVPQGNIYSISNLGSSEAQLVFSMSLGTPLQQDEETF